MNEIRNWLIAKRGKRIKQKIDLKKTSLKLDKRLALAKKRISERYYQLKIGHAITAEYLYKIKKIENTKCWWCSNRKQTINHLLLECRKWRKERQELLNQIAKKGLPKILLRDKLAKEKLFNPRYIEVMLTFIEKTEIGIRPKQEEEEEERRLDLYGIEILDE